MPARLTREEQHATRVAVAEAAAGGQLRLPEAVKTIRASLGLSQEAFGKLFKMTRRQISEIENGDGDPKLSTLSRIGRVFGFSVGFVPITKASVKDQQRGASAGVSSDRQIAHTSSPRPGRSG
jgi:putative transcriptional regulator